MKPRKLWIRRKDKSHVIEGRLPNGKTILIWTISDDLTRLLEHLLQSSFFTKEKAVNIAEKLKKLSIVSETEENQQKESSKGSDIEN